MAEKTGERSEWKECRAELGVPIQYYHRDDLSETLKKVVNERCPHYTAFGEDRDTF